MNAASIPGEPEHSSDDDDVKANDTKPLNDVSVDRHKDPNRPAWQQHSALGPNIDALKKKVQKDAEDMKNLINYLFQAEHIWLIFFKSVRV